VEKLPNKIEQNYYDDDVNGTESDNKKDIDSDDKDDKVTFYCFLKDHPLYQSVHVMLLKDMQGWVQILLVVLFQEVIVEIENIIALLCWPFLNHGRLEKI